jgi:chromate transporter
MEFPVKYELSIGYCGLNNHKVCVMSLLRNIRGHVSSAADAASPHGTLAPSIARLFLAFLKLGATSFGGPSIVVYIRQLAVEKMRWMQETSFFEGVALCQILPGATAMQTAAYVGFYVRGLLGAAAAFIGFGLPSFILMLVFSALYVRSHNIAQVVSAFSGLQVIIVAIIANAVVSFGRTTLKDWKSVAISLTSAVMFRLGISPIVVIVFAMMLGVILHIDATSLSSKIEPIFRRSHVGLIFLLVFTGASFILLFIFSRQLFDLAWLMSVINLFSFGGGFACLPLMLHEVVDVRHWLDGPTFLNGIILGQITPGPISISATFVGYLLRGPIGALVATIGTFLPAFLLLIVTAPYFKRLLASSRFVAAAGGTLCSFVGLLITVGMRFSLDVHWDPVRFLFACGSFVALLLGTDVLWVVLAGTAVSILFI